MWISGTLLQYSKRNLSPNGPLPCVKRANTSKDIWMDWDRTYVFIPTWQGHSNKNARNCREVNLKSIHC